MAYRLMKQRLEFREELRSNSNLCGVHCILSESNGPKVLRSFIWASNISWMVTMDLQYFLKIRKHFLMLKYFFTALGSQSEAQIFFSEDQKASIES